MVSEFMIVGMVGFEVTETAVLERDVEVVDSDGNPFRIEFEYRGSAGFTGPDESESLSGGRVIVPSSCN